MVLSLSVLSDPGQRGVLLPWFMRFREKISPEAYESVHAFNRELGGWLSAVSPVLALEDLTDLSVPAVLAEYERRPECFGAPGQLPEERLERLLSFMWAYWSEYFQDEFYWIEPLLAGSIRQHTGAVRKEGNGFLHSTVPGLAADLQAAMGNGATVRLLPSIFATAERVVSATATSYTVCYPVPPGIYRRPESLTPPEPLARLLKSLSDDTRLKLLKLMLEEHKCTKDLADELGLAEPTVSRHLRRLRDAELVEGVAEGNYIYYTAKLERIAELHMKVLDFLRS